MGGSELEQVEALVMQVLPDPAGFAERVIGQLMGRLASDGSASPLTVPPPVPASTQETNQPIFGQPAPQQPGDLLADRNADLAAALGACFCWGDDPACRTCQGDGFPAWTDPDDELYRDYVLPALRRRKASARAAATTTVPSQRAVPQREEGSER